MSSVDKVGGMWNQQGGVTFEDADETVSGASVHVVLTEKREAELFRAMELRMDRPGKIIIR